MRRSCTLARRCPQVLPRVASRKRSARHVDCDSSCCPDVRSGVALSGRNRIVRRKHLDAGYPASEVIVKPNFCGPSQKRQSPGEDFVYAGRLSEEKGIYDLAAGWAGPAKLVVLGDGDLRPRLEALANDRVELRGSVSPATVRSVIAGARAVMIPSLCYEGMPRSPWRRFRPGCQ